jgi:hypothetical protein
MTEGPAILEEVAGIVYCSTQCIKLKHSVKNIRHSTKFPGWLPQGFSQAPLFHPICLLYRVIRRSVCMYVCMYIYIYISNKKWASLSSYHAY